MKRPSQPALHLLLVRLATPFCIVAGAVLLQATAPCWARSHRHNNTPAAAPVQAIPETPAPVKVSASGNFKDSSGAVHHWQVQSGHVLEWDGTPYVPAGGVYRPHYWLDGQTSAAWSADSAALTALKQAGVTDVLLSSGDVGLLHVPAGAVQKVLDFLDANGFRYGIEIGDRPSSPLKGYIVKPTIFRSGNENGNAVAQFADIDGLTNAVFAVASHNADDTPVTGDAGVDGDTAVVTIPPDTDPDDVILLYPEKVYLPGAPESHMPDLWQGFDDYRDGLLTFFAGIHLGPGFRFFVDPLVDQIGMKGDIPNLVPSSDGFRLEFQAYLQRKYPMVNDLDVAWGLRDQDMPDFDTAARCIPLWYDRRGVPMLYDPVKKTRYEVLEQGTGAGGYWGDISDFKVTSLRGYMNHIAAVLKSAVADVPVLYQVSAYDPLFINDHVDGYDGLSVAAYGHGDGLATRYGADAFAMAEQSAGNGWLIAGSTAGDVKDTSPYPTYSTLVDDWNVLRDAGIRGFYARDLQVAQSSSGSSDVPDGSSEPHWIGSFAANMRESATDLESETVHVLWYPAGALLDNPGTRLLSDGVWWLPSDSPAVTIPLGSDLRAYAIGSDGVQPNTFVLWSPGGALKHVSVDFGPKVSPVITDASGVLVPSTHKGSVWTIPVGDEPVQISGIPTFPLPDEVIASTLTQAQHLLQVADYYKIPDDRMKDELFYAQTSAEVDANDAQVKFMRYARVLNDLTEMLRPYAWMEGEDATSHTFDAIVPNAGASGGAYLTLDTSRKAPMLQNGIDQGYFATYNFTVNSGGRYDIWLAGSQVSSPDTSPISYQIDNNEPQDVGTPPSEGDPYADGLFYWTNIGAITFSSGGPHTITIIVGDHRASDDRYVFDIDALCLSRNPFHPNGTEPPPIDIPATVPKNSAPSLADQVMSDVEGQHKE